MVKTEVILCDLCKKAVANLKCNLCGKDLCSGECSSTYEIIFGSNASTQFYFCNRDCRNKVVGFMKKLQDGDDKEGRTKLYDGIKQLLLEFIKRGLILENLKEEKK